MNEINYQIECTARDLVVLLMTNKGLSMENALRTLYMSETFTKLKNPETGLYYQSPLYVYSYLNREIEYGKLN